MSIRLMSESRKVMSGSRKVMGGSRKAYLYTIGLTLLAFAVLSLAVITSNASGQSQQAFLELLVFDRAADLHTSAQAVVSGLLLQRSGMNVTIDNASVIFHDMLPNPNADSLASALNSFSQFVQENDSHLSIRASDPIGVLLSIDPVGLVYNSSMGGNAISLSSAELPASYSFSLVFDENASCSWAVSSGATEFSLEVIASHQSGCTAAQNIDMEETNTVSIQSSSDPSNRITMTAGRDEDSGNYVVSMASGPLFSFTSEVASELAFSTPLRQAVYGNDTILVNFTEFNLTRLGGARIS